MTNTIAAPAYKGIGVRIHIDLSDANEKATFESLYIGQAALSDNSNKTGTIYSIDRYGSSFVVIPDMPSQPFDGSLPYRFMPTDTITLS